jgi:hypothetical protein
MSHLSKEQTQTNFDPTLTLPPSCGFLHYFSWYPRKRFFYLVEVSHSTQKNQYYFLKEPDFGS